MAGLQSIKKLEEANKLEFCPDSIKKYAELNIFNVEAMREMKKEKVKIEMVGQVKLDKDEEAIHALPPKFAVRRKLCRVEMLSDLEMASAKIRYQTHKENNVREIEGEENSDGGQMKRIRKLNEEEIKELEEMEQMKAEGRSALIMEI